MTSKLFQREDTKVLRLEDVFNEFKQDRHFEGVFYLPWEFTSQSGGNWMKYEGLAEAAILSRKRVISACRAHNLKYAICPIKQDLREDYDFLNSETMKRIKPKKKFCGITLFDPMSVADKFGGEGEKKDYLVPFLNMFLSEDSLHFKGGESPKTFILTYPEITEWEPYNLGPRDESEPMKLDSQGWVELDELNIWRYMPRFDTRDLFVK